ncbi:MAG: hypothetical protein IJO38_06060 [Akkermansia sp.]|nr:hypothetical protein [Akkermansia sp.]
MTITIEIPLQDYMTLAGAAALNGMDVTAYTKHTLPPAPAPEPVAAAQPALPAPAPLIAEPAPVEPRPMTPEEEDALLGTIGA